MNFLVDMPLSPALALWLRANGHDALHAHELGMSRFADRDLLEVAASQSRVIITADLDFPRLLATLQWATPGVILLRSGNYSEPESLACLQRVLIAILHADLPLSIVVVDREKIRRRWLPLL